MTPLLFVLPALLAAVLSYWLVRPACAIAVRVGAIDLPGPRKVHTVPVPRLGGLAVVMAAFIVLAAISLLKPPRIHLLSSELLAGIAAGLIPIFLVSFFDDIRSVRPLSKLLMHFLGAGVAVSLGNRLPETIDIFGTDLYLGWLAIPISLLWIAGVTNAFNIIDGLDGLAPGLALISSASLAAVALVVGRYEMASASLILAGALIGFLPYNMFPAKIFLGDTGATGIGFVLACLTLGGSFTSAGLAVALPLLIVGVPLADTVISILRRVVRKFDGDSSGVFDADSRHIHHRLLALGLNQRRTVLTLYTAATMLALLALLSLFIEQRKTALLLMAIFVAAFVGISKLYGDEFSVSRRGTLLRIYEAPFFRKGLFIAFIDILFVIVALYVSIVLKYDDWTLRQQRFLASQLLALLPALTIAVFGVMRVYRCYWRDANIEDMLRITAATLTAGFAGYIASAIFIGSAVTPTLFVLYTICLLGLVACSRVSYRVLYYWNRRANRQGEPIVIYGAGKGGTLALRELLTNFEVPMNPIGFIDDDPAKCRRWINGYPVFGSLSVLEELVTSRRIRGLVVASTKIEISKLKQAISLCNSKGLWIRRFHISFHESTDRRRGDRRHQSAPMLSDRRRYDRRTHEDSGWSSGTVMGESHSVSPVGLPKLDWMQQLYSGESSQSDFPNARMFLLQAGCNAFEPKASTQLQVWYMTLAWAMSAMEKRRRARISLVSTETTPATPLGSHSSPYFSQPS